MLQISRPISSVFKDKKQYLRVVAGAECKGCYYFINQECHDDFNIAGPCSAFSRPDYKHVKFVRITLLEAFLDRILRRFFLYVITFIGVSLLLILEGIITKYLG